ncbi:nucleotide exchange factor GrpE [Pedobacter sp. SL55]|uniref:nucleotide exchange factor GrpE n=1 Tax=Pedobacter sp. SL55 TaxID=2995161 RepID=UPI00226E1E2E|nr:nucleotide exchange factor GrpE [Pedobacter sp. SL55]WAC39472.1 nucleotide exchange factor GrpE [Pedobacter sp. SL55]
MFNKKKKEEEPVVENNTAEAAESMNENVNESVENTAAAQNETVASEPVVELSVEEKLQQQVAELNDKYLRLFAEFDNFKRRTQKERVELLQTAGKDIVVSLLPVLDDFERAIKATEKSTEVAPVREGIELVQTKLKSILSQKGLKEIESLNTPFDTDLHEAITQIPSPTEEQKGKVIDQLEKGYTLNDKVVRFAKVVVGA